MDKIQELIISKFPNCEIEDCIKYTETIFLVSIKTSENIYHYEGRIVPIHKILVNTDNSDVIFAARPNIEESILKYMAIQHFEKYVGHIKYGLSEKQVTSADMQMQKLDYIFVYDAKIYIFEVKTRKDKFKIEQIKSYLCYTNNVIFVCYKNSKVYLDLMAALNEYRYELHDLSYIVFEDDGSVIKQKLAHSIHRSQINYNAILNTLNSEYRYLLKRIINSFFINYLKMYGRFHNKECVFGNGGSSMENSKQFTKSISKFLKRLTKIYVVFTKKAKTKIKIRGRKR